MTTADSSGSSPRPFADIPGPEGDPLLGNTAEFVDDQLGFYTRVARTHGPIARYSIGRYEFLQVSDPEYVQQVLVRNNQAYTKGERFQSTLRPALGNGLLTSEGSFWRSQRHAVEPAFHPDALQGFGDVMVEATERLCAEWTAGHQRDIHDDMMSLTVEIAAEALFDIDIRDEEEAIADALETVMDRATKRIRRPIDIPDWAPTPGNRRFDRAMDDLHAVADRIIDQHEEGTGNGIDVVSLLQSKDDPPSREQIRDEVVTILLAGHETTALALTYTLHLLSENPRQRAALQAELDDVLGGDRPTVADLPDLPYTEQVVKEGMRIYPPVYDLIREAAEPDVIGGYRIPEGTSVTFQQWVLHRDPRLYDDPLEFRPGRWTDGFERELSAFAYFPFGGGPRRCIGDRFAMMEARLVLATMLQDWTVESTVDELSFAPSLTLRPDGPVEMIPRRA
ncbi:cytochrome P450 [Natranaeroarchaeum aerophilus]|uniref:Cytochrome P450 n=1 Tax=Natranaeroarchaeum aerophilus TaxID=2917711 RepID=A0AAE3FN34_9EURY|nr:cytochrome P450 [Natranaeroarchaeum aerophilus]MCL9812105.1 cytochrome P450 [Natranaeroarchaeum aerophilus]